MTRPVVVVCGRVTDPLIPGAKRGYECAICGLELQATARAQGVIAAGGSPYCTPHGLEMYKRLQATGYQIETVITEYAAKQMDEMIEKKTGGL